MNAVKKIIACFAISLLVNANSFSLPLSEDTPSVLVEEGYARYYSANLRSKFTSSGEKYDDSQLTGSHSRYPINTIVKVTNLENNLSVQVRINDVCKCDGQDPVINLSKEAANRLGMMATGKAMVRLEVVSSPSIYGSPYENPSATTKVGESNYGNGRVVFSKENDKNYMDGLNLVTPSNPSFISPDNNFAPDRTYDIYGVEKFPKGYGVQVTALSSLNSVQDLYDALIKLGIPKEQIFIQVLQKDNAKVYRVLFGEFYTKEIAMEKNLWISQFGYRGVIRAHYNL